MEQEEQQPGQLQADHEEGSTPLPPQLPWGAGPTPLLLEDRELWATPQQQWAEVAGAALPLPQQVGVAGPALPPPQLAGGTETLLLQQQTGEAALILPDDTDNEELWDMVRQLGERQRHRRCCSKAVPTYRTRHKYSSL